MSSSLCQLKNLLILLIALSLISVSDAGIGEKLPSLSKLFSGGGDPDEDICKESEKKVGVVADDGQTYLFTGSHYWTTKPLDKSNGINSFAKQISSKWPEIDGEIRFAFTVQNDGQLMTVFVVKTRWLAYASGKKVMEGTTEDWPDFKNIDAMFNARTKTTDPDKTQVYAIYNNNNNFFLYDFKDMTRPEKVKSGPTVVSQFYLWFLEKSPGDEVKRLKELLDVTGGLNYDSKLVLLSKKRFCLIDLNANLYEKECLPKGNAQLLKCPLDLSKRPTTERPTKATEPVEEMKPSPVPLEDDPLAAVADTAPSKQKIRVKDDPESGMTSIPILGRSWPDGDNNNKTTKRVGAAQEEPDLEKNRENSVFWMILFLVGLIFVAICVVVVVGMVARIKRKRPKGVVFYTNDYSRKS